MGSIAADIAALADERERLAVGLRRAAGNLARAVAGSGERRLTETDKAAPDASGTNVRKVEQRYTRCGEAASGHSRAARRHAGRRRPRPAHRVHARTRPRASTSADGRVLRQPGAGRARAGCRRTSMLSRRSWSAWPRRSSRPCRRSRRNSSSRPPRSTPASQRPVEYERLLDRLNRDDLPRFEARFKELLNVNTINEIANFNAQLARERETIKERVATHQPVAARRSTTTPAATSCSRHRPVPTRRSATSRPSCAPAPKAQSPARTTRSTPRPSSCRSRRIIDRFRGRDGLTEHDRRWTAKVTDVRNWFLFAASERWREDDTEHEHYSDSGGKSGGQKEKLAYTILAASLAYQFGLEWGAVRSRSFRFVVIDEAFGRGSDESARYGLRAVPAAQPAAADRHAAAEDPRHRTVRGQRGLRAQRGRQRIAAAQPDHRGVPGAKALARSDGCALSTRWSRAGLNGRPRRADLRAQLGRAVGARRFVARRHSPARRAFARCGSALKTPSSADLTDRFEAVRAWTSDLAAMPHVRIEWREVPSSCSGWAARTRATGSIRWTAALTLLHKRQTPNASRTGGAHASNGARAAAVADAGARCRPSHWLANGNACCDVVRWLIEPSASGDLPSPGRHSGRAQQVHRGATGRARPSCSTSRFPRPSIGTTDRGEPVRRTLWLPRQTTRIRFRVLDRRIRPCRPQPSPTSRWIPKASRASTCRSSACSSRRTRPTFLHSRGPRGHRDLRRGLWLGGCGNARWLPMCDPLLGRHRHPWLCHPRPVARSLRARVVVSDGPRYAQRT